MFSKNHSDPRVWTSRPETNQSRKIVEKKYVRTKAEILYKKLFIKCESINGTTKPEKRFLEVSALQTSQCFSTCLIAYILISFNK